MRLFDGMVERLIVLKRFVLQQAIRGTHFFYGGVNVESVENHELWLKKRVEIEKGDRVKED